MTFGFDIIDFRATATRFVNIFVFLLFFETWGESSIVRAEYSASKVYGGPFFCPVVPLTKK